MNIISSSNNRGVYFDNSFTSYKDIRLKSAHIADFLNALIPNGRQNIGIYMHNSLDYIVAYFGILFSNNVIVPIYRKLSSQFEISNEILISDVSIVFTNNESFGDFSQIINDADLKVCIVNINNENLEIYNSVSNYSTPELADDKLSILLQSSGTTNNPKKIMHSKDSIFTNMKMHVMSANLTENEKTLIQLPMTFSYCNTAQMLAHIYINADIYIGKQFTPESFIDQVIDKGITNTILVPTQLTSLALSHNLDKLNTSKLQKVFYGGSHLNNSILEKLLHTCPNVCFVNTYGQTEAGPRISINMNNTINGKFNSAGKPLSGIKIDIRNIADNEEKPIGDIFVNTPCMMLGYYKNKDLTKDTIKSGWLDTGDRGYIDEDGYLYITGRKKNIIISGGINIYPEEIENVLESHEKIIKAYVYGVSNPLLGEVPCADVEITDHSISETDIIKYCKLNLSAYKVPVKVKINNINLTVNGKKKRNYTT